MSSYRKASHWAGGFAIATLSVGTNAQVADPAVPAAAQTASGLEEIVVTAQKRSENLQNVPIAVAAVTGQSMENLHATSLLALAGSVPSIQINTHVNTPNTAVFYIRGMGIVEPDPYAGTTVSIVVDGVPQYFSMGALLNTFDIDRVEILRGPQGTLFGANTTGGVVNVVTRQPTGEWGGRAEVTYGKWNRFDLNAAIDVPIVKDVLAAKLVAAHTQRDGWFKNIYNGKDIDSRNVSTFRGYLKLTPSADFDATLMGQYDRAQREPPSLATLFHHSRHPRR